MVCVLVWCGCAHLHCGVGESVCMSLGVLCVCVCVCVCIVCLCLVCRGGVYVWSSLLNVWKLEGKTAGYYNSIHWLISHLCFLSAVSVQGVP